jgi:nucleoside-specific outer membrane channel protein Tsx
MRVHLRFLTFCGRLAGRVICCTSFGFIIVFINVIFIYPTSRTYQHHQHTKKYHIIDYFRYIDDLLIICNRDTTNIENTLTNFNPLLPNIKFTIKKETQNKLNYLT